MKQLFIEAVVEVDEEVVPVKVVQMQAMGVEVMEEQAKMVLEVVVAVQKVVDVGIQVVLADMVRS